MGFEPTQELKDKLARIKELSEMSLVYGIVDEDRKNNGVLVWKYAVFLEYGTDRMPSRPFFRSFIWNKKTILNTMCKNLFSNCADGKMKPITAYKRLGRYFKSGLTNSILNGTYAPLNQATIEAKGNNKPLVDTGTMLDCVGFVIYKNDVEIYKEVGGYGK